MLCSSGLHLTQAAARPVSVHRSSKPRVFRAAIRAVRCWMSVAPRHLRRASADGLRVRRNKYEAGQAGTCVLNGAKGVSAGVQVDLTD